MQAAHPGHGRVADPGAARQQQAGVGGRHREPLGLFGAGQHGIDDVFDLVEGHVAHQVLAGRHGREVLLEKVGHDLRVDVALLELHGRVVVQVQAGAVEHRVARAQVEPGRHVGRGREALDREHLAAVVVAALADFAGDVGDLQQRGLRLVLGHEAAHAGHAHDAPLLHELAQGAVHGHARHAELRDQLVLGRQAVAGRPRAVLDLAGDVILDLRIEREGRQVAFHRAFNVPRRPSTRRGFLRSGAP
ncbi:hypothetical protein D3C87_986580 [compost metagenome]